MWTVGLSICKSMLNTAAEIRTAVLQKVKVSKNETVSVLLWKMNTFSCYGEISCVFNNSQL